MNREACCLQLGQLTDANWNHPLASGFTRERRLLHPATALRHSTNELLTELKLNLDLEKKGGSATWCTLIEGFFSTQVSTETDFLCRTCMVWGRSESRSREVRSSSRHEATTEPERTDDISQIHPISEEIHAQHGRHQCPSQKTDREGCWVEVDWDRREQFQQAEETGNSQYSGSTTLHCLSHSQSTRHLQVLVVSSCRKANQ